MKMYIGRSWIPFPRSEYGGVWALIAESDKQAIEMLTEMQSYDKDYIDMIPSAVEESEKFELSEYQTPRIVTKFFT